MKAEAVALILGALLTVEQRDAHRSNHDAPSSAVSTDGRYIAFTTFSRLVPADEDNSSDVYVLDRSRQQVTLESPDTPGQRGGAAYPGISGDGRFVIFERAHLILLHDREENTTRVLGEGQQPAIAENGRIVYFCASTLDRAAGVDVNGERNDVYSIDLANGRVERVSVGMDEIDPKVAASVDPSTSSDGRYVAFSSKPHGSREETPRVYVRDTALQVTRLIGAGWSPSLSGNGRFVAFVGLKKRVPHILVADLSTGVTRVVTNGVRGGLANGPSAKPAMSSDGRFVAFQSEASDLVAGEDFNLLWDVFVLDRTSETMARLSGDRNEAWMEPSNGPSIDATGSVVSFSSRHPTDAMDKRNDFDLYVATIAEPSQRAAPSARNR